MIKFLESLSSTEGDALAAFCEGSVFGLKAFGPVLSYGLGYDFVSAWEQRSEGERTAFLSKYYGTVTVHCTPDADREELLSFLKMVGFSALFGSAELLKNSYLHGTEGCVMALEKGRECTAKGSTETDLELCWDNDYADFYEVLSVSNPGYLTGDYADFLTDFSHRVRHGTAHILLLKSRGRPVATTAALVKTEGELFLGGVATLPEERGKHYASTCLLAFCDRYPEHRVFLCCRPEKQAFYEHLGFAKVNDFLELESSQK